MKAPFGQTGVSTPLMVRPASPFPALPNTKFESRELIVAFARG
jgi:hypothetical protein